MSVSGSNPPSPSSHHIPPPSVPEPPDADSGEVSIEESHNTGNLTGHSVSIEDVSPKPPSSALIKTVMFFKKHGDTMGMQAVGGGAAVLGFTAVGVGVAVATTPLWLIGAIAVSTIALPIMIGAGVDWIIRQGMNEYEGNALPKLEDTKKKPADTEEDEEDVSLPPPIATPVIEEAEEPEDEVPEVAPDKKDDAELPVAKGLRRSAPVRLERPVEVPEDIDFTVEGKGDKEEEIDFTVEGKGAKAVEAAEEDIEFTVEKPEKSEEEKPVVINFRWNTESDDNTIKFGKFDFGEVEEQMLHFDEVTLDPEKMSHQKLSTDLNEKEIEKILSKEDKDSPGLGKISDFEGNVLKIADKPKDEKKNDKPVK